MVSVVAPDANVTPTTMVIAKTPSLPKRASSLSNFSKLVVFCRPELPKIFLGFSALVVNAVTNLSFPWILGEAIDQTRLENPEKHFQFILGTAGLFAIASIASFVRVYCLGVATQSIAERMKKVLFNNIIYKSMDFYNGTKKGQLVTLFEKDVDLASEVLTEKLAAGLRSINSSINGSILLFQISPYLFSISIGILPIIGIGAMKLSKVGKKLNEKTRQLDSSILTFILERLTSITTIRLYGREQFENQSYASQLTEYSNTSWSNTVAKSNLMGFINFATNISLCSVLYVGGNLIKSGKMTPGDLTKFALQAAFVGLGFSGLSVFYDDLQKGLAASSRLFEVIDEFGDCGVGANMSKQSTDTTELVDRLERSSSSIEFKNVSFRYKLRDQSVLNELNLTILPNRITAIVGRNGAGKSTMLALLSGLYTPTSGSVFVEGKDIFKSDLDVIRKKVGIVEQTVGLLSGSITSNIAYGKDGATMDEIELAARNADAHDFIQRLPDQYNTQLGEAGSLLSGGQKARIALARALVRNPELLLLDEATAALDKQSEIEIAKVLKRVSAKKTVVVFTHSEVMMQQADVIHVLKDGKILISGNYYDVLNSPEFVDWNNNDNDT